MNSIVKTFPNLVRPNLIAKITAISSFKNYSNDFHHPEGNEPPIPVYSAREGESTQLKKARLIYQSRKRGMLENGLVLSTFAKKYLDTFNEQQLILYDRLINLPSNDWDLFYWAVGVKPTPAEFDNEVMNLLKKHVRNDDRQSRIVQPDLY
ncbi:succinate dehydrogenase assembly factor 2, mitochondrial-like [Chelonus insularis]|uniref:succinate dehydrogenase assembly factor 2, mitochondrial-like n=1 Tax=Chelonus insularis TaxID=460826 RepID=UPI001588460F|nr:succinate dehydrogenase assembly factor 2, mitochondrial-like [Chelonus insularis]